VSKRGSLSSSKRRRKAFTILWISALVILTMGLIYWEQVALLYILATLGVTALLVVVALADLGSAEATPTDVSQPADAAAMGSGISSTYNPNQSSSWGSRKKG